MTFFLKFHLKANRRGGNLPIIYGSLPELGGGNPAKGIALKPIGSVYNFIAEIRVKQPNTSDDGWYSYCYRPPFGTIVHETVPKRYLPKFSSNLEIYDSSEAATAICELVVRFRVKCHTNFGEELFIVGDCKELGNWQPQGAQQLFYEEETDSWIGDVCFPLQSSARTIQYKYFISGDVNDVRWEPEENHIIHLDSTSSPAYVEVSDTFRWVDPIMSVFTRSAFTDVLTKRKYPVAPPRISPNSVLPNQVSINFTVMCPHVRRNQQLAIVGDCAELGEWEPENALFLADADFPIWNGAVTLSRNSLPFEYKYVIFDRDSGEYIWESAGNRKCYGITSSTVDFCYPATVIVSDWYVSPNRDMFKGMAVQCPIFSLRTNESCGIGQYSDVRSLVDMCRQIGASMIQILPINDTTEKGDIDDSSPYKAISCFALHPIYINMLEILPNLPSDIYNDILSRRCEFEQKREVDYQQVYRFKIDALRRIYSKVETDLEHDKEFKDFCQENEEWLKPYSLFCLLRDEYKTADFRKWPEHSLVTTDEIDCLFETYRDEALFTYWVQYICDRQFKASREYATASGIVLKCELTYGVPANSAECWANRKLFNLDTCIGAPPDAVHTEGINYHVPSYNWTAMRADNFSWWRLRLKRFSDLFHAAQLDHILGFFRTWQIPVDSSFRSILGHYSPCNPLTRQELESRGLWDIDRYVKPYIRFHTLQQKFQDEAANIAKEYFEPLNINPDDDFYEFKERCNTELKMNELLSSTIWEKGKRDHYRACLLQLLSNVILIPDESNAENQDRSQDKFHFRSDVTVEHVEPTPTGPRVFPSQSWLELDTKQRQAILEMYQEYNYKRQVGIWVSEAIPKLEMLQGSTNLLLFAQETCPIAEELDHEIESKSILSLRVPRFPKDTKQSYDPTSDFQYMAQVSPSLPDTSTIRGWWEENKNTTLAYWRDELEEEEQVPEFCFSNVLIKILKKNLESDSMWCTFLLQDIVDVFDRLRKQYPDEERIFHPDKKAGWVYRYPWTLEELVNDSEWTNFVHDLVKDTKRD
ncbi:4-alpha-glucanotransferase family protein [Tritrichomonas foetus]|uniref:4-alpha-glucanotransferase n=1 Tax=Tritrichomonas foetus TaxID=1144522 RepID=A0A1J4KYA2_9EUKA|nr:4-alpha-glucanotransferase family protein [Tritrichomonas foetus]|eukprot:OHT16146.1 4-alpha-glucanotransferase family protein [Tritrichomonas foetus]